VEGKGEFRREVNLNNTSLYSPRGKRRDPTCIYPAGERNVIWRVLKTKNFKSEEEASTFRKKKGKGFVGVEKPGDLKGDTLCLLISRRTKVSGILQESGKKKCFFNFVERGGKEGRFFRWTHGARGREVARRGGGK